MSDQSIPVSRNLRPRRNISSALPLAADSPTEAAEPRFRRRINRPHPRVLSAPSTLDPSIPPCSSAEDSPMDVAASSHLGRSRSPPSAATHGIPIAALDVHSPCNQQSVRLTGSKRKSQHIGQPTALEQTHNARRFFSQSSRGGRFACTSTGHASDRLALTLSPSLAGANARALTPRARSGQPCVYTPAGDRFACTSISHSSDQLSLSLSRSLARSLARSLSLSLSLARCV